MEVNYIEHPLLFVNSTDSSIPKGRNERTKFRTQEATVRHSVARQGAHFGVLNFRKRPKRLKSSRKNHTHACGIDRRHGTSLDLLERSQSTTKPISTLQSSLATSYIWPLAMNPLKIVALAAFHIRRISAMFLQKNPGRLTDVLRCRQWSYVTIALDRVGRSTCLDSALCTIGSKLWHMTGGPTSNYFILSNYTRSLRTLQAALNEPKRHENDDLLLSSQVLAVYEMLESLDNTAWTKHVNGARVLGSSKVAMNSANVVNQDFCSLPVLPMVTDALLDGNGNPLHLVVHNLQGCKELTSCLSNVAELLVEANSSNAFDSVDSRIKYSLLDRAHRLKVRLRAGLMNRDYYSNMKYGAGESFDLLGLSLAGMVSLDCLIKSLRPVHPCGVEAPDYETGELCAQLLQFELKAADAYPANDLLSAFELSVP